MLKHISLFILRWHSAIYSNLICVNIFQKVLNLELYNPSTSKHQATWAHTQALDGALHTVT